MKQTYKKLMERVAELEAMVTPRRPVVVSEFPERPLPPGTIGIRTGVERAPDYEKRRLQWKEDVQDVLHYPKRPEPHGLHESFIALATEALAQTWPCR
jgi:hypothetical protein